MMYCLMVNDKNFTCCGSREYQTISAPWKIIEGSMKLIYRGDGEGEKLKSLRETINTF